MRYRRALSALLAGIVFVGVMLVMLSTGVDLLRLGVPIALVAAVAAALATWRWSEHQH